MRIGEGLTPLLQQLSLRAGCRPIIEHIGSTPWASVTFTGTRHRLSLRFEGSDAASCAARLCDGLGEAEFELGRYLLVDIEIAEQRAEGDAVHITLETLIIDND